MGLLQRLFGISSTRVYAAAKKTMQYLKIVENTDRKLLIDVDSKLFVMEAIMNKLEFSRPICVIEYLKKSGATGDKLISNALLQIQ